MTNEKTKLSNGYSRIAIVTGASSGIGEATARKFIASGYGVIGNARNAEKLGALEKALGQAFCGIAGDATELTTIDKLFSTAIEHFGKPADIVVANAGRGLGGTASSVGDPGNIPSYVPAPLGGLVGILRDFIHRH